MGAATRLNRRSPAVTFGPVMGMGGVDGPAAARRRRLIAGVLVLALVLGAGAVVLSFF